MDLSTPRYVLRDEVLAIRSTHVDRTRFEGLWVSGSLEGLARTTVAIVGPRAPSEGARHRARVLAGKLAARDICVLSGLALGIDGESHAGALDAGGITIGVLGGGHRHFFPLRNRQLAEAMLANGGAVLSPYHPDAPALPWQFLARNGIVAALADRVVIVEAAARSGALNTAHWANELGIDVLVFPGDVDRPKAAGCNALIRDGATLVRDAEDVFESLQLAAVDAPLAIVPPPPRTDPLEAAIVATLALGPADFERLLCDTGAATADLIGSLVRLEMDDAVVRRDVFTYALPESSARAGTSRTART